MVESDVPWSVPLTRDAVISVDNFAETPDFVRFFHVLSGHVLDPADGGHIDFFVPLGSCGRFSCLSPNLCFHRITHAPGWRRVSVVRTSIYNWPTFPDLCLIYG